MGNIVHDAHTPVPPGVLAQRAPLGRGNEWRNAARILMSPRAFDLSDEELDEIGHVLGLTWDGGQ